MSHNVFTRIEQQLTELRTNLPVLNVDAVVHHLHQKLWMNGC